MKQAPGPRFTFGGALITLKPRGRALPRPPEKTCPRNWESFPRNCASGTWSVNGGAATRGAATCAVAARGAATTRARCAELPDPDAATVNPAPSTTSASKAVVIASRDHRMTTDAKYQAWRRRSQLGSDALGQVIMTASESLPAAAAVTGSIGATVGDRPESSRASLSA